LGLSHGDTEINISVDGATVTGNVASKTTTIGDYDITSNNFAVHGFQVDGGDQAWAGVILKEHSGSTGKPVDNLANPSFSSIISGGTIANIVMQTTEAQTTSTCGGKITLETSPDGRLETTTRTQTLELQGNTITVNTGGNGVIKRKRRL